MSKSQELLAPEFPSGYLKATDLPFDFKRADHTWKKYGYAEVPLNVRDSSGKIWDDRKYKGIFQNGLYRKQVSRGYVLLPNEECDSIVTRLIRYFGAEYGLYLFRTYDAYHGDAKYWEIRSKKTYTVDGSHDRNDKVQLGFIMRNSVGCNVNFGVDVFTFRLVCENGAIARGKDLLSLKVKHYGKDSLRIMTEGLAQRVHDIMQEGVDMIHQYERAARLKLRLKAAEDIAKRVSWKYLPDYIEVDEDTRKVSLTEKNVTFWRAFNDSTEKIWHSDISFLTKGEMTNHLHRVMEREIEIAAK
jgi:hypothetical protein